MSDAERACFGGSFCEDCWCFGRRSASDGEVASVSRRAAQGVAPPPTPKWLAKMRQVWNDNPDEGDVC